MQRNNKEYSVFKPYLPTNLMKSLLNIQGAIKMKIYLTDFFFSVTTTLAFSCLRSSESFSWLLCFWLDSKSIWVWCREFILIDTLDTHLRLLINPYGHTLYGFGILQKHSTLYHISFSLNLQTSPLLEMNTTTKEVVFLVAFVWVSVNTMDPPRP